MSARAGALDESNMDLLSVFLYHLLLGEAVFLNAYFVQVEAVRIIANLPMKTQAIFDLIPTCSLAIHTVHSRTNGLLSLTKFFNHALQYFVVPKHALHTTRQIDKEGTGGVCLVPDTPFRSISSNTFAAYLKIRPSRIHPSTACMQRAASSSLRNVTYLHNTLGQHRRWIKGINAQSSRTFCQRLAHSSHRRPAIENQCKAA